MSEHSLQRDLLDQLDSLPVEEQQRVLDFARTLARPAGKPGHEVLLFGGAIAAADLGAMTTAIQDGCEQVNVSEW